MRIYKPKVAEGLQWALPVNDDDFEVFLGFDGSPRRSVWTPVRVELISSHDGVTLRESDFPWLGSHVLVLSSRAVQAVGGLLSCDGELLPLACQEADLWVFNPTSVIDALDHDSSECVRFSSGRIMKMTRYVFHPELIGDAVAFKVPALLRGPTFVTDRFVAEVAASDLRGANYEKLWDSQYSDRSTR